MEITIIVKDGMVQDVYGTDQNISVSVIDLDVQDTEVLETLENDVNRVRSEQQSIW